MQSLKAFLKNMKLLSSSISPRIDPYTIEEIEALLAQESRIKKSIKSSKFSNPSLVNLATTNGSSHFNKRFGNSNSSMN